MDVFSVIQSKQSISKFKNITPSNEMIEKILETGTWAPNHHRTESWRFFVLMAKDSKRLGDAMADALEDEIQNQDMTKIKLKLNAERNKPLRAPVIIAIAITPSNNPVIEELEEYAAVSISSQNMMLVVHSLGLGSILRTGKAVSRKKVNNFFGLKGKEHLFGFLYIGYPDISPPKGYRISFKEKTIWINE